MASLNATRQASWVNGEVNPQTLWTVAITASGQLPVTSVLLNIAGSISQIWEVVLVSDSLYRLPDWRLQAGGIAVGQSHVFGFIVNNNSTTSPVSIASVQCGNVSASPSANPSPSPTIVNTPMPSASPNASVSPIVSPSVAPSPSPSPAAGVCSINVTQSPRAGAGGSWTDNTNRFQIFDILTNNNGSRPLTAASVTIVLAADQEITQFWNLQRVGNTNTFNIPSFLLPAVGATEDGLGYVLRTPLNSTSAASSLGAVTFAC
jgi:hypothetical protein